jgi:hypothetical protein
MAAKDEVISKENIGIGDEVFLTGLFVNHLGKKRNIPIVRVGNIAAMPEEAIATRNGNMDAYLIEARSIGGLSGSPVFVHLAGLRILGDQINIRPHSWYWLGLMHGHWEFPLAAEDVVVQDSATKEAVNMGIGIVVPSPKILEIINQKFFVEHREMQILQTKETTVKAP